MMYWFALTVSVAFLGGAAFGATVLADHLARIKTPRTKQPAPLYKAGVVVDLGEWRRLELPTVRRKGVN